MALVHDSRLSIVQEIQPVWSSVAVIGNFDGVHLGTGKT